MQEPSEADRIGAAQFRVDVAASTKHSIDLGVTATANNGSWSIHGRILPYLDQANLYNVVNLSIAWDFQTPIIV